MSKDPLANLPSRSRIAELILRKHPHRNTFAGWEHYRRTRGLLVPAPMLTAAQLRSIPLDRRSDYDLYRQVTNVNLPLQQTPMLTKVNEVIDRRLLSNPFIQDDATLPGVMVSGFGNHGKTAAVCALAAEFEDYWLDLHGHLDPTSVEGTWDLHAPVAYVSTPVTATPKSLCESILNFFGPDIRKMTLPQLLRQVADSLRDHGVMVLILDDINRLRMHRSDDQDVLDMIRALMGCGITLILSGVNIPGTGLLREATYDRKTKQWVLPPLETHRVHGLEVTQTERRFDLVELDRFPYDTPAEMRHFVDHLKGIEDHLRLMKAKPGMLTSGGMPEYLYGRCAGVVGILGRLVRDAAIAAMQSGKEKIDEALLEGIIIGRENPAHGIGQALDETGEPETPKPKTSRTRPRKASRNTVFDDHGPQHSDEAAS
ncbi:AAA family ATPase [Streptomyces sp. NPDC048584]|uniref:AAA family ATPase n=1 Tax=Streptomyces sp. NPDC048584 TaxID=3365573 RepID=UPI0037129AB6